MNALPPPVVPPPVPVPTTHQRARWLVPAVLVVLALTGGLLVWASMGSGRHEMAEGSVTIPTVDDTVVLDTAGDDSTNANGTMTGRGGASDTTLATADSDAVGTTPVPTSPATTETQTTVPATTVPATTMAPTTVTPTTAAPTTAAPTSSSPATTAPTSGVVFPTRCSSDTYGWDVGVAAGWFTVDASNPAWACAAFDRSPVVIDEATEVVLPITISFIETDSSTILASYRDGSFVEILGEGVTTVGPYDAWRLETRATGEGMVPAGTLGVAYLVNRGGWSTVIIEGLGDTDADYAAVRAVVDAMAADIQFWDG